MVNYFISFFILVVVVTLIFRFTTIIIGKFPNDLGNNAWFLLALIGAIVMVINFVNPEFFKKHTGGNGLPPAKEETILYGETFNKRKVARNEGRIRLGFN